MGVPAAVQTRVSQASPPKKTFTALSGACAGGVAVCILLVDISCLTIWRFVCLGY